MGRTYETTLHGDEGRVVTVRVETWNRDTSRSEDRAVGNSETSPVSMEDLWMCTVRM